MAEEQRESGSRVSRHYHSDHHTGGAIYFFGMIGAIVYYVQQVHGFWPTVLAIFKGIAWPAFLVYHVFTKLHM